MQLHNVQSSIYYAQNFCFSFKIGNINEADQPRTDHPSRWLSHRDWGQLVTKALTCDFLAGHFEVMYGVSQQPTFDWQNSFGYEPRDSSH